MALSKTVPISLGEGRGAGETSIPPVLLPPPGSGAGWATDNPTHPAPEKPIFGKVS